MAQCRVLDSRLKGRGFEPHRRHCVVSLSKNINLSLVLVQPGKTRPFITERLLMGRKESNQTNQHTKYAKRVNRHTFFKSSAKHVPVFMILEVRPKIKKKKAILFLPLPLQYLQYVKRSIGWQTFFL